MAKPRRTTKEKVPDAPPPSEELTSRGKALATAGGALVLLGLLALTQAGEGGKTWAFSLSPILIAGGYTALAAGLFSGPQPPAPSSPS